MKVQELLSDKSKWTKGVLARSKDRCEVVPRSRKAVCWCLWGALLKCYPQQKSDAICKTIEERIGMSIGVWNDSPERKFPHVKKLAKEMDI